MPEMQFHLLTHRQGIVACWYFQVPVGSTSYIMMTRTQTKWRLHVSKSVKFIRRTLYEQTDDGSLIPWTGAPYVFPRPVSGSA